MNYTVTIPMRTKNPLNTREHWRKVANLSKANRMATYFWMMRFGRPPSGQKWTVTLTRLGRKMDAGCGLNAALKPVRDGVADWLGIDDGSPLIEWRYAQQKGSDQVRIDVQQQPQ